MPAYEGLDGGHMPLRSDMMIRTLPSIAILYALLCCSLSACGSPLSGDSAVDPPHDEPAANIAVTKLDIRGSFAANTAWNDPHVMKIGSAYVMYLSRGCPDIYADGRQEPVSLFSAASSDGITWTIDPREMLGLGTADQWDHNKAETPSVVFFRGAYHLYYSGGSQYGADAGRYSIGHAVGSDGRSWVKDALPVLTPAGVMAESGAADVIHVAEPGAVVVDGTLFLYFTVTSARPGGQYPSSMMSIYLATSADGYTFSNPKLAIAQGPRYPAASGYRGYSTPSAIVNGETIELYYDVYFRTGNSIAADEQVKLHRAVSADGIAFAEDGAPLLSRENQAWTAREIRGGSELVEDGVVKMWFSGDDYSVAGGAWSGGMNFGYAQWPQASGPH